MPTETGTGGNIDEIPHGNGYARVVVTGNATWLTPAQDGVGSGYITNTAVISFNQNTGSDWGWVSGVAILDNSGDAVGNMLWYGSLSTAKLMSVGDTLSIPTGSAVIKLA